ncbi:MAG: hypothetical protein EHM41_21270 [Chloroflexi bacterium]|nr:MAG: hypothetical protein EHM41_21270 [Chloroflexota bacterium]
MNILLNPNIAFLALVLTFLLSALAILVPGTGLVEVLAVVGLLFSAYAIVNLHINYYALAILLVGVFPFLFALRISGKKIFLVPSLIALLIGSTFLFVEEDWTPAVNPILALTVSGTTSISVWLLARKLLEAAALPPLQDVHRLVGMIGTARTKILDSGTVHLESELWSARSEQEILAGSEVRVVKVDGITLVVEKVDGGSITY